MGRTKGDIYYWNQVTTEGKGKWKCKHCNRPFSGGFSRIKAHIDKTKGKGIAICSVDPGNERVGSTSNSSHLREVQNILNESQGSVAEHIIKENNNVNGIFQSEISDLNKLVSDLTIEEEDIKGQLRWLESRGKKRKSSVNNWLNELQNLKKRVVDMKNSLDAFGLDDFYQLEIEQWVDKLQQHQQIKKLTVEVQRHKIRKPVVLSNEFFGEDFEHNVQMMWGLLENDQVFIIGIHGMGGVGKTFLATYMENEIKRKATFNDVFWVTVSHDFNIFQLQEHIAKRIGIKLYEDDERTRSEILAYELEKIEKSVIVLDDVWKYIDLEKVGVPLKMNGIKLIITSRLKHVCRQMNCLPYNIITKYPFSWEEGRELFWLKLGHHGAPATLAPEILEIARSIENVCAGLPLGISVMGRILKGCYDTYTWRHALNKLEKMEIGEEVKEMLLPVAKRSYDNLVEKDLQKCFLYCVAMLVWYTTRFDLVVEFLNNGLINEKGNLEEMFDEGYVIVDKLIDHSLLSDSDCGLAMHGLLRNMMCHILNKSHNYMIRCNQKLRKIPRVQEWTIDLEVVYLASNKIEEIPRGASPNCPRLSTLILYNNSISHVSECFFTHLNAITVLDLSFNSTLTSLPNSLSNLRSLMSLVLTECSKLEYIPPLGELQALSRLDISCCSILQVPKGLQNLINLKWLDMHNNVNLTLEPACDLASLTNMQYLDLRYSSSIKMEDVQGMRMLEMFGGRFMDQDNFNSYVQEIQDKGCGPKSYFIHLGKQEGSTLDFEYLLFDFEFKCQRLRFENCQEFLYLLPRDLAELFVHYNSQWVSLCDGLSSNRPTSLKCIDIASCTQLKHLFCLSNSCSFCTNIQSLEDLRLNCLESLTVICKEDVLDLMQFVSPRGVFSLLKKIHIEGCHEIETLITPWSVPQLQNLEYITVLSCNSLKEIFAIHNNVDQNSFNITLPKLIALNLCRLPQLKIVCKGIIICGFEDILSIYNCPNLERLPTIQVSDDF
ncbi:hypothetical protein Fmac_017276 [Flemingia macrophylla]|uniref:NB-ARC domain-containing protein n=1 Tax=Flemingia macrophylla TaxID=520843 RepID=A0ABD1M1P6_9FABA